MGVIWEVSFTAFAVLTVVLGGGAAMMMGRAMAETWRTPDKVVVYAVLLGLAVRFFHWGLAGGSLLSIHFLAIDAAVVTAAGLVAYQAARTSRMIAQYPWLYRRTSPLTYEAVTRD